MSEKENRIRAITRIYYSNPKIQEVLFNFSNNREVIPRYFEGFGKRPDTLQYPSDVIGLVNKGATSFHASEEIWFNPLEINSDMKRSEIDKIRKSWDLLIDIDSPYLDCSKIAAILIIKELEKSGISNYGLKFSGSKGFHIIVPSKSFPESIKESKTSNMFPEWPRAISEYLMYKIKTEYNKQITNLNINFDAVQERIKLTKKELTEINCPNCGEQSEKNLVIDYECPRCKTTMQRPYNTNNKGKRKLRCIEDSCPGYFEIKNKKEHFFCKNCNFTSLSKIHESDKKITYTKDSNNSKFSSDFKEQVSGEKMASLDLVLVSPRHLFRMPYSLHEKTSLASIVISKNQILDFNPKDADPLKVKVKNFYPTPIPGEATKLLESAIYWKNKQIDSEEKTSYKTFSNYKKVDLKNVPEEFFPKPIKILLKGLPEGRKRGLFILLTFLRTLNYSPEYIDKKIKTWNEKNDPPLKQGYIKSQISWILKQKKQILPPNYKNDNFYKDLKLIDSYPKEKNPIVEVVRKVRNS
jgi:hypothetical protein